MTPKDDSCYKYHTNDELIDEIERGLRKGYWDKRLLPEVRKRFGSEGYIIDNRPKELTIEEIEELLGYKIKIKGIELKDT